MRRQLAPAAVGALHRQQRSRGRWRLPSSRRSPRPGPAAGTRGPASSCGVALRATPRRARSASSVVASSPSGRVVLQRVDASAADWKSPAFIGGRRLSLRRPVPSGDCMRLDQARRPRRCTRSAARRSSRNRTAPRPCSPTLTKSQVHQPLRRRHASSAAAAESPSARCSPRLAGKARRPPTAGPASGTNCSRRCE